jgi:hypothetical protein
MATNTIPGLTTIATPSSGGMLWICDTTASPQDRSLSLTALTAWLKTKTKIGLAIGDSPYTWATPYKSPALMTTGSSQVVVNLPAAAGTGALLEIIKIDSGTGSVKVTPNGTDVIDIAGNVSVYIDKQFQWLRLRDIATGIWQLEQKSDRIVVTTSGTIGTLIGTNDAEYFLTAASTVTLPAIPAKGQKLTFRNTGDFTSVISANTSSVSQTIGVTISTAFSLYAANDYVTLEYDGTSKWYVVSTNGPEVVLNTTARSTVGSTSYRPFTGMYSSGVLPGVYEVTAFVCGPKIDYYSAWVAIAIGSGATTTTVARAGHSLLQGDGVDDNPRAATLIEIVTLNLSAGSVLGLIGRVSNSTYTGYINWGGISGLGESTLKYKRIG